MTQFDCKCGFSWSITQIPEQGQWIAYASDVEEEVVRREAESAELGANYEKNQNRITKNDLFVAAKRTLIYECQSCGRLAWYRGEGGEPEWFLSER